MRFVVLVKANPRTEAGVLPTTGEFEEMGAFNEELAKSGVLLGAEGLQPSSKGARIKFSGDKTTVTDGPFSEAKELVAGFWLVQGKSKEEVIERFRRVPFESGEEIEIRQIYEAEDFGENLTPELRESERRMREAVK